MSKSFRFGSAVSAAVLASMIAGCATPQAKISGLGIKANGEVGLATQALAALNSNDIPTAISFAERAVAKTPDDAGFRALLGNAYFAGGRFRSAEAAYKDSLTIYSNQPRVLLKLVLVQIALGKNDEAMSFLNAGQAVLDPADYGLALALAGHPADAVAILQAAAREPGADSRVRQNLALAYAFAGDWTQARTVASQDVPADQLDTRIHEWMQMAKPAHPADQLAALVGVKPAAIDPGQPVQLALNKSDTQLASAAPAPQPQVVTAVAAPAATPQPVVAVAPAPPPPNPQRKPAIAESDTPVPMAMMAAAAPDAPAAFIAFAPKPHAAPAPARNSVTVKLPPVRALALHRGNSNAVVQLGAYSSPQAVAHGWAHLTGRYPALRAYLPVRAKYQAQNGVFWRLSIQGFKSPREAIGRCQLLRSRGGNCFVRTLAGDAPVQLASL